MKLVTTTGDFGRYIEHGYEAIKYIKEAGFKYADYNFAGDYAGKKGIYSGDFEGSVNKILKAARDSGITFVQAHSPMGDPITQNGDYEDFIWATKKSIECSARLGIKNLVVHSGYGKGMSKEETYEKNREFYLDILNTAEKYDVNILTENFNKICVDGYYWIDNVKDQLELIEYVNHPLFHGCYDTGHANLQDMSQKEQIETLGTHLFAIHVHDNMGTEDTHNAPWYGTLDMDSLMEGLINIGYKGYFTFEACSFFPNISKRKENSHKKLSLAPLSLRLEAEKLLYKMGEYILESYDCYEE